MLGFGRLIEPTDLLTRERNRQRLEIVDQLIATSGPDDRTCDALAALDPFQGHLRRCRTELLCDRNEDINDLVVSIVEMGTVRLDSGGTDFRSRVASVLPAQYTGSERTPGGDSEPELAGHRKQIRLDGSFRKAVLDLERNQGRPVPQHRFVLSLHHDPRW